MNLQEIEERINSAPSLEFGNIFDESTALFKKVWVQGLVIVLLSLLLMLPMYLATILPFAVLDFLQNPEMVRDEDISFLLLLPNILLLMFFVLYIMVVSFALQAAFFRICRNEDLVLVEVNNYFYYFKGKYISKIIVIGLASFGISLVAMMLCFFPLIYVSIPLSFFTIIFAFNPELSVSEIIKASFSLGNKKWLITFGLVIIASFLAQIIGMLLCFVGVFVTASFVHLPIYFVYKKVIGFNESSDKNFIGL
ncbi:hypothetical protein [Mesonia maritima]|uniref:Glycerophosphoryl diester phosphodiesterase membrane domain-containing protein n=1 Tax=Mesonia maritima TaxID=1793873 RepID=A0ABU1K3P6_9FLAO|nr:hypothetical protein [Mesonia maritima]MDR6300221.1 hypothetical protein [Mesonia maritima]